MENGQFQQHSKSKPITLNHALSLHLSDYQIAHHNNHIHQLPLSHVFILEHAAMSPHDFQYLELITRNRKKSFAVPKYTYSSFTRLNISIQSYKTEARHSSPKAPLNVITQLSMLNETERKDCQIYGYNYVDC